MSRERRTEFETRSTNYWVPLTSCWDGLPPGTWRDGNNLTSFMSIGLFPMSRWHGGGGNLRCSADYDIARGGVRTGSTKEMDQTHSPSLSSQSRCADRQQSGYGQVNLLGERLRFTRAPLRIDGGAKNAVVTPNSIPRMLFTGRLIQRKGVEYLLRAVPLVLAKTPARFLITGNGDQRESLEALARSLHIEHTVEFLGFVSNERLNEEYARCDIWVNPSIVDDRGDTEGLAVGAIEAFAHGKPVIASAVGGIPDAVVHNATGLLVPEKDPKALAHSLLRLIHDPDEAQRLAARGLEYTREKFNWDSITDRLEAIYWNSLFDGSKDA